MHLISYRVLGNYSVNMGVRFVERIVLLSSSIIPSLGSVFWMIKIIFDEVIPPDAVTRAAIYLYSILLAHNGASPR